MGSTKNKDLQAARDGISRSFVFSKGLEIVGKEEKRDHTVRGIPAPHCRGRNPDADLER